MAEYTVFLLDRTLTRIAQLYPVEGQVSILSIAWSRSWREVGFCELTTRRESPYLTDLLTVGNHIEIQRDGEHEALFAILTAEADFGALHFEKGWSDHVNAVYVAGAGEDTSRDLVIKTDETAIAEVGRLEELRDARDLPEGDLEGLLNRATVELTERALVNSSTANVGSPVEEELVTITAVSPAIWLKHRIVLPPPATVSGNSVDISAATYDEVINMPADAAMHQYLQHHAIAPADSARAVPFLAADLSHEAMPNVTYRARFQTLLEVIQELGRLCDCGFDIVLEGEQMVFHPMPRGAHTTTDSNPVVFYDDEVLLDTPGRAYQQQWDVGDRVSVRYIALDNLQQDLTIQEIKITLEAGKADKFEVAFEGTAIDPIARLSQALDRRFTAQDALVRADSGGGGGGGSNHDLLSIPHQDTVPASPPTRGDLVIGNATPKWARLGIGASGTVLKSNGIDPSWGSLAFTDITGAISAVQHGAFVDGDLHTEYVRLAGRAGGTVIQGSPTVGEFLTLRSDGGFTPIQVGAPLRFTASTANARLDDVGNNAHIFLGNSGTVSAGVVTTFGGGIRVNGNDIKNLTGNSRISFDYLSAAVLFQAVGLTSPLTVFSTSDGSVDDVPLGMFVTNVTTGSTILIDNNDATAGAIHIAVDWQGTTALVDLQAGFFSPSIRNTGGVSSPTNMTAVVGRMNSREADIAPTNARVFWARSPKENWQATVKPTVAYGFDIENQGRPTGSLGAQIADVLGGIIRGQLAGTNAIGLYIEPMLGATAKFGVYQAGDGDSNILAGPTSVGANVIPATGVALHIHAGRLRMAATANDYIEDSAGNRHITFASNSAATGVTTSFAGAVRANLTAAGILYQGYITGEANPRIRVQTDRYEWRTGGAATTGMDLRRQNISTLDFVRDASAAPVLRGRIEADTQPRWELNALGGSGLKFGPGGSTAPDVSLSRVAANEWQLGAEDSLEFQAKSGDPTLSSLGGTLYAKDSGGGEYFPYWQSNIGTYRLFPSVSLYDDTGLVTRVRGNLTIFPFSQITSGAEVSVGNNAGEDVLGDPVFRLRSIATNDDPEETAYQNRVATTDATVTTLHTVAIPASKTVQIVAYVQARRTGGTAGTAEDGASHTLVATVKNVAGTATHIGTSPLIQVSHVEALNAFTATIDVNGANARIRVTGALNNNVTWHATIRVYPVGT